MLSTTQVKDMIEKGLAGASAEVNDLTGTGDHFEATVVSEAFHALKLKTMTPEQAK